MYGNIPFNPAMGYHPHNLNKAPKYKDIRIRKMSVMVLLVEEKNKNECSGLPWWHSG